MPLDALCISALTDELNNKLSDMRIDKIQQPEKDVFIFNLRGKGDSLRLLLSSGIGSARVHITEIHHENPQNPPMFCMLLRKHLNGARIISVTQPYLERAIDIKLEAMDEIGVLVNKHVIVEMIGKHSNFILLDGDNRIIDCLRKVDSEMSEKRQVLPGMFYRLPPSQNKLDPLKITKEELEIQLSLSMQDMLVDSWLLETFMGLSPLICREIAHSIAGRTDVRISQCNKSDLINAITAFIQFAQDKKFMPVLISEGEKPFDITFLPVKQYGNIMSIQLLDSFSELLDGFYTGKERLEKVKQRSQALHKSIKNLRDRTAKKLMLQKEELKATYDRERLREQGDIIKANLYNMHKGMSVLKAQNFYSENNSEIEINLDPKLSPQQNAAKYYKAYSKAKNAEAVLSEQIQKAEAELDYLESVLDEISRATGEKDLNEIRYELISGGYLKNTNIRDKKDNKKQKLIRASPMRFASSKGLEILVGKNNLQNDMLTLKTAQKNDIWLHTQKIHGSHVIVLTSGAKNEEIDEQTLLEAAALAAYYSKARDGENVPVDYTKVKYVKKPSGAKPGMVVYTDYRTLYVTPDEALVKKLKK